MFCTPILNAHTFIPVILHFFNRSDNEFEALRKPKIEGKIFVDKKVALREHDYCQAIFKMINGEEEIQKTLV